MIITPEQFKLYKSRDLIPLKCIICDTTFYRTKNYIQSSTARGRSNDYCSNICWHKKSNIQQEVECLHCKKIFNKKDYEIKKSPNHFCSLSCSITYRNAHKTTGYRRSKMEIFLEQQIEQFYPELGCLYNDHSVINSELDFYFPTLKFAIELNGIFHYEPIYGQDKLEKIQSNDNQKSIKCQQLDIEFCTIDTSSCKHLTQKQKDKYWSIVQSLIVSIIKRHSKE